MSRQAGLATVRAAELRRLQRLAESAARRGGEVARRAFGRVHRVTLKSDRSEVTAIDIAAQRAAVVVIHRARPQDGVIGEEGLTPPRAKPEDARTHTVSLTWVIDPIDGTRNYIRGVPHFMCSVAAMLDGEPIAAAMYDPMGGTMYAAARGQGATCGGLRIRCDRAGANGERKRAPLIGIPSSYRSRDAAMVDRMIRGGVVRSLGSATLHLAFVATGAFDAAFLNNSKMWDIAAGWLIVREAGGVVCGREGRELFPLPNDHAPETEMPTLAAGSRTLLARLMRGRG